MRHPIPVTVRDRLAEPWGIVVALILGGMGAAVVAAAGRSALTAVLMATVIAGIVYGINVGLGLLAERPRAAERTAVANDARPWLARASAAVTALEGEQRRVRGASGARTQGDAADRARAANERLRRRADALAVTDAALAGTDITALRRDHDRLRHALDQAPADSALHAERRAAMQAVEERISAHQRLVDMRALLLANLESTVLRLEAVAARASVLTSLQATTATTAEAHDLTALADELDAARLGLEETEKLTRQVLGDA